MEQIKKDPLNSEVAKEITKDLVEYFKEALRDERSFAIDSIVNEVLKKYVDIYRSVSINDSFYLEEAYQNAVLELLKDGIAITSFYKFPDHKPVLIIDIECKVLSINNIEDYTGMGGWIATAFRTPDKEDMKRDNGWFMGCYEDPEHEKEVICTPLEFKDGKWYTIKGDEIEEVFEWMPYPSPRFKKLR